MAMEAYNKVKFKKINKTKTKVSLKKEMGAGRVSQSSIPKWEK